MMREEIDNRITDCIEYICNQYNIPATLNFSQTFRDRTCHTKSVAFIDIMIASYFSIEDEEVLNSLAIQGIKCNKDYRKLRSLVRTRLIDAAWSLRNLAEESLRNLGAKV